MTSYATVCKDDSLSIFNVLIKKFNFWKIQIFIFYLHEVNSEITFNGGYVCVNKDGKVLWQRVGSFLSVFFFGNGWFMDNEWAYVIQDTFLQRY